MEDIIYLRVRKVKEFDNGNIRIDFNADNTDGNNCWSQWNIPKRILEQAIVSERKAKGEG